MLQMSRSSTRATLLRMRHRKLVSTWSPLATAFSAPPSKRINFTREDAGLFRMPELRTFEGFYLLRDNVENKSQDLIAEAISSQRQRKMVDIFDELSDSLCKVADLAEFIRIAHPKNKYMEAAEQACISICCVVESLNTHKPLYQALRKFVEQRDLKPTTEVDQHVAKLFLFDFEQCGIHLPEAERLRVVRLNDYILQLGQKFMNGAAFC
ncbi:mitochondrial intermediate peptidase-like [Drosophila miranda]|uniref:mitochondrial intermediate peptidase-like n=1 Tax=Drosophila miranda TaxID=7229 RepID=UPI00143FB47A|nr:mitochondrial intermediate peptidase-like [Drosophila miranda]